MTNSKLKAGILLATLGVPALIFIFLKVFGSNKFDLPKYFPQVNDSDEVIIKNGDTLFTKMPSFNLISQESKQEEFKDGEIRIVSFFFSRCGTVCPITNKELQRVVNNVKDLGSFKIFSLTVDPKYDTPDILKKYVIKNGFENNNWYFLTGDKAKIYDLAIKGFKLPVSDASEYNTSIKNVDEMFIHSDKVMLIDREGICRGIYTGTDRHETDRLMVELKVLLKQK